MPQKIFTDNFLIQQLGNLQGQNSSDFVQDYFGERFHDDRLPKNSFTQLNIDPVPQDLCERMIKTFIKADSVDFECGKILYETLNLTLRDASNPGLWSYLHHYDLFPYIKLRWPDIETPPNKSSSADYIKNHWVQDKSSQAELLDYPLSGLWWAFQISKDLMKENPYELTAILFKNVSFRTKYLGQSKVARHKEAVIGILEFIKENNLHKHNFEENGRAIVVYVNLLGGIKPLSYFKKDWFKKQLEERFKEDIRVFARLYRRDEKPENSQIVLDDQEKLQSQDDEKEPRYLNIYKRNRKYIISDRPSADTDIQFAFFKNKVQGFLLFCYENAQVNKVPIKCLFDKQLNIEAKRDLYRESNLIQVLYSKEDCLLLVTGKGYRGMAGKIFETEFISPIDHLNAKGKKLLKKKKIEGYEVLPVHLKSKVKNLVSNAPNLLFDEQEYPKEWDEIDLYRRNREKEKDLEKEALDKVVKDHSKQWQAEKSLLNIYNASGKYFFTKGKPASSTISVELPENFKDKCLFLFYDNGQVCKLPLKKLPLFSTELKENGKYSRAGLVHLAIGVSDSYILVSRYKSRSTFTKIHKAEWIPDYNNLNDKGKEIVDAHNKLVYALLPPDLPTILQRMVGIDIKYGIDLNNWIYKDQKRLLNNLVPHFFAD